MDVRFVSRFNTSTPWKHSAFLSHVTLLVSSQPVFAIPYLANSKESCKQEDGITYVFNYYDNADYQYCCRWLLQKAHEAGKSLQAAANTIGLIKASSGAA